MAEPSAESWEEAFAIARQRGPYKEVVVSKADEPCLPSAVSLRPSNFPWSIHKGASRVYRQDEPGDHFQIREYRKYWSVELDQFNPHYDPLSHARGDVPPVTAMAYPVFASAQGLRITADLSASLIERQAALVTNGIQTVTNLLSP